MATTYATTAGRGTASHLPPVLRFMQLLWAVVHGLERTSKRMNADLGVTGPQRLVLRVAGLFPGLSAGALAAILHVHPSTLTGVLQRLEREGLLTRQNDAADRRRAVLRLTPRGTRINATSRGTVESAVAAALRSVSARDSAATSRVLERIASQFEAVSAPSSFASVRARRRGPSRRVDAPWASGQ
jgi:DNA-binding MarR family transcriptional regulator